MDPMNTINRELHTVWPAWTAVEKIGEGSFGEVYRIVREGKYESALKIISIPSKKEDVNALYAEGADPGAVYSHFQMLTQQVQSEIELMESMKSAPHIVSIEDHAVVQTDGIGWRIYIRMELLQSMGSYIRQVGRLSEAETLKLGMNICEGVSACHSRNIIHRDIKPGNIFRSPFGDFKLGDFGIARKLEGAMASTRAGTPSFEAPEVAKGIRYDRTADIYAIGMVLYIYMNRGRRPFLPLPPQQVTPAEAAEAQERRFNGAPLPPPVDASPELASIILKACAYYPNDRYQSAEEMQRDLNSYAFSLSTGRRGGYEPRRQEERRPAYIQDRGIPEAGRNVLQQGGQDIRQSRRKSRAPLFIALGGAALLVTIILLVLRPWKQADPEAPSGDVMVASNPGSESVSSGMADAADTSAALGEDRNLPTAVPGGENIQAAEPAANTPAAEPAANTPAAEPVANNTPTPEPAATNTPTPEPTETPKPTATPVPAQETSGSLYPDAEGIVLTASSYNEAAPDWTEYTSLIEGIRSETDPEVRKALMHRAEDILMATGAVIPLYYYNDLYLQKTDVEGIFSSLYGFKYFQFATSPRDVLKVNLAAEPAMVDPALNSSVDGACLDVNLFAGLCTYDSDGSIQPDLAESWEVSEDGLVWTFRLHEGLRWSDGTSLTAEDFEYSWKRAADPMTAADYAYMFDGIALNADGSLKVEAADDRTFVITLNAPCVYFLDLCAFPAFFPVPRSQVEAADGWETDPGSWAREAGFVTNGAYTIESWDHDVSMVFRKNPYYHKADQVSIEEIDFILSADDIAIYMAYISNDLDFADTVPTDEISSLMGKDEFHVVDNLGTYFAAFNVNSPLFEGKTAGQAAAMRKAFSLLIDRQYIVDNIGQTGQKPATSFIPAGMADGCGGVFKENTAAYSYPYAASEGYYPAYEDGVEDEAVEEARALLEKAGYRFTEDGVLSSETPISFTYLTNDGTGHIAIAEAMQMDFAVLGIEMKIETCDWYGFLEERRNGRFDFAREGWLADYNDPINMLEMWTPQSLNNDCQLGREG